jgi:hypothetical protein
MIKSLRMRWEGHAARMGEKGNAYKVLVRKSEGNRLFGRLKHRWEDDIKRIGCGLGLE